MSKRKNDQVDGDGIHDDDKVQALKAKRVKGKERVTFADGHRVREFNVDAELEDTQVDELVEGDRITRVRGEEDQQQWSDDEIEVEPFNLKSENEEGYFDKNGNYVEHKMEKGVEDAWLDEYDEKWAKKMEHNKSRITSKAMEEDNEVVHDKVALLKTVLNFLQTKESATAALKRLGGGGKTATTKKKVGKGAKDGKDMTDFYKLSDAIDALLHGGYNNIYSDKKEQVQEELDNELANQASSSSSNEVMWEYKGQDGALFGPYTSANMRDWRAQGYFTGESAVPIRKVKSAEEEDDIFASSSSGDDFVSSDSIDFSQYP